MEGEISDQNDDYHESKEDLTSASSSESVDEDQGRKYQNRVQNRPAMTATIAGQERPPLWSSSSNLNSKFSVWKDNPGSIQDRRQRFFRQTGFKNLRGEQRFGHRSGSLSKSVSAPELETRNSAADRLAGGKQGILKQEQRIKAENGARTFEGAHKNGSGSPEFELSMIEQFAESNGAVIRKRSLSDQLLAKKGDTKAFSVSFIGPIQYSAKESFSQGSQDLGEQYRVDSKDGVSVITGEGSPSHREGGSRTQKSQKSNPSPLHKGSRVWSNSSQELEPTHQHQPSSSLDELAEVSSMSSLDEFAEVGANGISMQDEGMKGAVYRIRNLDSGKEFVVDEFGTDGTLEKFKDVDTGKELTLQEFESSLGLYPVMQELKRQERETDGQSGDIESEQGLQAGHVAAKKKGWLGNIKGALLPRGSRDKSTKRRDRGYKSRNLDRVGSSKVHQDKEGSSKGSHDAQGSQICGDHRDVSSGGGLHFGSATEENSDSAPTWQRPQRIKVRSRRKSNKQLSELHLGQKIDAHQGAIWTMKFSPDGHYLASAGQDQVVCVWEIVDHPLMVDSDGCERGGIIENGRSEEAVLGRKPGKGSSVKRKSADLSNKGPHPKPFWLSNKATRSFCGHTKDVLDLSWSRTQLLLSSSMDKTVRLWHISCEGCLGIFSHNDYVTCIQFNPVDDRYFLSGAFDDKLRIWSIADHQVVDWTDLGEMVTALCYSPDGKRAIVGSHKGTCRYFNTTGNRLQLESHIDVRNDRNRKAHGRKITGLQCMPGDPSKVLVTSNDSRIRVYDQLEMISEYRGFRNVNSQISGSFCGNGELILSASEHSRVYVWNSGILHPSTKSVLKDRKQSCEEFYCHHVSVAIPLPAVSSGVSLYAPGSETPGGSMQSGSEGFVSPCRDDTQDVNKFPSFDERDSEVPGFDAMSLTQSDPMLLPASESSDLLPENISKRSSLGDGKHIHSGSQSASESGLAQTASETSITSRQIIDEAITAVDPLPAVDAGWGLVIVTGNLVGQITIFHNYALPIRL